MKLADRERVDGTPITIGRRVRYRKTGEVVSRSYAAEYRDETGKQVCEGLGTRSKLEARRKAMEIFGRLRDGRPRVVEARLKIDELIDDYFKTAKAKGLARKSEWKYRADLDKLKAFCREQRIKLAHRFGREAFFAYREVLVQRGYADKTVYGVSMAVREGTTFTVKESHLCGCRPGQ